MKYLLFLVPLFVFSCKNTSQEEGETLTETVIPAGFAAFYLAFHSDSIFQIEHIIFPLQGLPDNADSLTIALDNYTWQASDWTMQRTVDFEMSEFKREFIPINEQMVVERILHQTGDYGMIRRFARVAGEWHLIYYAGMNRLAK